MKVRKGFVSNSSSSSFICEVCGDVQSGYDAGLADVEFVQCVNGHTYCESHDTFGGCSSHGRSEIPAEMCPICSMTTVSDEYVLKYLLKDAWKSQDQVIAEIKARFSDYNAFTRFLNSK